MRRHGYRQGFTLVELLIVIVVIAILAAITVVSYRNTQTRATNVKISTNVQNYVDVILMYRAINRAYPPLPGEKPNKVSMACLGLGYPDAKCGNVSGYVVKESQPLMDSLKSVTTNNLPVGLDTGSVKSEAFIGAVYGIDQVGPPAPHTGYGRVVEWFLIGENQNCNVKGAYGYATGNGNTACELFLEATS